MNVFTVIHSVCSNLEAIHIMVVLVHDFYGCIFLVMYMSVIIIPPLTWAHPCIKRSALDSGLVVPIKNCCTCTHSSSSFPVFVYYISFDKG